MFRKAFTLQYFYTAKRKKGQIKKEVHKDTVKMGKKGKRDRWGKDWPIRNKGEVMARDGIWWEGQENQEKASGRFFLKKKGRELGRFSFFSYFCKLK